MGSDGSLVLQARDGRTIKLGRASD